MRPVDWSNRGIIYMMRVQSETGRRHSNQARPTTKALPYMYGKPSNGNAASEGLTITMATKQAEKAAKKAAAKAAREAAIDEKATAEAAELATRTTRLISFAKDYGTARGKLAKVKETTAEEAENFEYIAARTPGHGDKGFYEKFYAHILRDTVKGIAKLNQRERKRHTAYNGLVYLASYRTRRAKQLETKANRLGIDEATMEARIEAAKADPEKKKALKEELDGERTERLIIIKMARPELTKELFTDLAEWFGFSVKEIGGDLETGSGRQAGILDIYDAAERGIEIDDSVNAQRAARSA